MQDVILVLWEKFDTAADFQGWAFGVAKNVALRHLRRQSRDRHVFDDDLVNQLADDAVALVPVHDGHREALDRCLDKLPAAQRDLVLTAYTKGTRTDLLARRCSPIPMDNGGGGHSTVLLSSLSRSVKTTRLKAARSLSESPLATSLIHGACKAIAVS